MVLWPSGLGNGVVWKSFAVETLPEINEICNSCLEQRQHKSQDFIFIVL